MVLLGDNKVEIPKYHTLLYDCYYWVDSCQRRHCSSMPYCNKNQWASTLQTTISIEHIFRFAYCTVPIDSSSRALPWHTTRHYTIDVVGIFSYYNYLCWPTTTWLKTLMYSTGITVLIWGDHYTAQSILSILILLNYIPHFGRHHISHPPLLTTLFPLKSRTRLSSTSNTRWRNNIDLSISKTS